MAFDNGIIAKTVKNAIQPTSSDHTTVPSTSFQQNSSTGAMTQQAHVIVEQPQQINMLDLDLMVPPSGKNSIPSKCDAHPLKSFLFLFSNFIDAKQSYTYNEESSDEDEEANECLLQL